MRRARTRRALSSESLLLSADAKLSIFLGFFFCSVRLSTSQPPLRPVHLTGPPRVWSWSCFFFSRLPALSRAKKDGDAENRSRNQQPPIELLPPRGTRLSLGSQNSLAALCFSKAAFCYSLAHRIGRRTPIIATLLLAILTTSLDKTPKDCLTENHRVARPHPKLKYLVVVLLNACVCAAPSQ